MAGDCRWGKGQAAEEQLAQQLAQLEQAAQEAAERLSTACAAGASAALEALAAYGNDAETLALGVLAQQVRILAGRQPLAEALATVVGEERERLLENWYRPSSTSAMSNAVALARGAAAGRFVRRFGGAR